MTLIIHVADDHLGAVRRPLEGTEGVERVEEHWASVVAAPGEVAAHDARWALDEGEDPHEIRYDPEVETEEGVLAVLRQAVQDVKDHRAGKLGLETLAELIEELRNEAPSVSR